MVGAQLGRIDEHYRYLIDRISDGILVTTRDGTVRMVNPAAERLLDRSQQELLGRPIGLPVVGGDFAEINLVRRDGEPAYVELRVAEVEWKGDSGFLLSLRDVTLRHEAAAERLRHEQMLERSERALREQAKILQVILDNMTEGVLLCDDQGAVRLVNPALLRLFGHENGATVAHAGQLAAGVQIRDLAGNAILPPEWPIAAALAGSAIRHRELRLQRPDGQGEIIISQNAMPVSANGETGRMAILTVQDITAVKQSQQALIRSEKLAAAGRLAAAIAHEMNNPLEAMVNLVYLMKHSDGPETQQYLDLLEQQLDTVSRVARQTLRFCRESGQPAVFDIAEVILDVLEFYRPKALQHGLLIEPRLDSYRFVGFSGEVRQVVSNLVLNAMEAMPSGGRIVVHVRAGHAWGNPGVVGCRISVADTGPGIEPQHLPRLMEPFFTTKGETGTGLGLWVTTEIIRRAGGSIHLRTSRQPGASGSCFTVFLPQRSEESTHPYTGYERRKLA